MEYKMKRYLRLGTSLFLVLSMVFGLIGAPVDSSYGATYTVTYVWGSGIDNHTDIIRETDEYIIKDAEELGIVLENRHISGWLDRDSGIVYGLGEQCRIEKSMILYAQFELVQDESFNVTYINNGQVAYQDRTDDTEYVVLSPEDVDAEAEAENAIFLGWFTAPGQTEYIQPGEEIILTGDVVLQAKWDYVSNNVVFVYYVDVESSFQQYIGVVQGSEHTVLDASDIGLYKEGFVLTNWINLADNQSYVPGDSVYPNYLGDFIFTAQWRPDTYDGYIITERFLSIEDGIEIKSDSIKAVDGGDDYEGTAPEIDDYKYVGYKIDDVSNELIEEVNVTIENIGADHTVFFYYEKDDGPGPDPGDKVTITYEPGAGYGDGFREEVNKGSDHEVLDANAADVHHDEYRLIWWEGNDGKAYKVGETITVDEDLTLTAVWGYRITYYPNGGDGPGRIDGVVPEETEDYVVLGQDEGGAGSYSGHTFDGWSEAQDAKEKQYSAGDVINKIDNHIELFAVWSESGGGPGPGPGDPITITYDPNAAYGGTGEGIVIDSTVGAEHTVLGATGANVSHDTYSLIWWNTQANGEGTRYNIGDRITPSNNLTLYAVWGYNITYDSNGGSGSGTTVGVLPENARHTILSQTEGGAGTRSSYRFEGWSEDSSTSTAQYTEGDIIDIESDLTLYATWYYTGGGGGSSGGNRGGGGNPTTTYNVVYHANNGTDEANRTDSYAAGATVTVRAGSIFTAPDQMVFRGWSLTSDGEIMYDVGHTFTMPANTVNLYAVWEQLLNYDDHYAYIVGYEDGTVRPNNNVSREEVATIFFRLFTDDARNSYNTDSNQFADVGQMRWSNIAISTLANARIIQGDPGASYRPGEAITRAELAVIAARFDNSPDSGQEHFNDVADHWAKDYINRAADLGWVTGYSDGTYNPDAYITRAELVSLVNSVLGRNPSSEALSQISGMSAFSDIQPGEWNYLAIMEAANSHYYSLEAGTEVWTAVRDDRNWAALERPGTIVGIN